MFNFFVKFCSTLKLILEPFLVPDSKNDHIECSISDTGLFTPGFVQLDTELEKYEDIYPITKS